MHFSVAPVYLFIVCMGYYLVQRVIYVILTVFNGLLFLIAVICFDA